MQLHVIVICMYILVCLSLLRIRYSWTLKEIVCRYQGDEFLSILLPCYHVIEDSISLSVCIILLGGMH